MWDDKKFQAFEYRDEEQLNLTDSFLRAFAAYLETHKLSSRIALSKANTSNKFFMEYCQPATMSQICEEVNRNETLPAEATEWIFKGDTLFSGSAVPVICRGCKRTSSDDHKHYVSSLEPSMSLTLTAFSELIVETACRLTIKKGYFWKAVP